MRHQTSIYPTSNGSDPSLRPDPRGPFSQPHTGATLASRARRAPLPARLVLAALTMLLAGLAASPLQVLAASRPLPGLRLPGLPLGQQAATQRAAPAEAREINPGQPIGREIAAGEVHIYRVGLAQGQYFRFEVEQHSVDAALRVLAPDGKLILEVNAETAGTAEAGSIVAEAAGNYLIEVRPANKEGAGRYEIRIMEQRQATAQDRARAAAERIFWEGDQLRAKWTAQTLAQAITKYEETLPLWQQLQDPGREALALNEIGFIYNHLGDAQKSLEYSNRALSLWKAAGNSGEEAVTLNNIGMGYLKLGDLQKAYEYILQSLAIERARGNPKGEAHRLNALGTIYSMRGEFQKALNYLYQSVEIYRALKDGAGEGMVLSNMGLSYDYLGETGKALELYNLALPLRKAAGDRPGEAAAYDRLARAHVNLGQLEKALVYYNQALSLNRTIGDRYGEAYSLNGIGWAYARMGDLAKALDYYNQTLAVNRSVGDRYGAAMTLSNLGQTHFRLGNSQKAVESFDEALSLNRIVGDRRSEAMTLQSIARVQFEQGDFSEARSRLEAAINIIESTRADIASHELRASYFAASQICYELYTNILIKLHQSQPKAGYDMGALLASERARARGLLELLAEAKIDVQQGINPALKEREKAAHQKIAHAQNQFIQNNSRSTPDKDKIAVLEGKLKEAQTELDRLEAEIRQSHPQYAEIHYPTPLGLKDIQQSLDDKTVLLEYSLGKEASFLFAISRDKFLVAQLPAESAIAEQVSKLRQAIAANPDQQNLPAYLLSARSLYRILVDPAATLLAGKRSIIVIPDAFLYYLPFELLLQSDPPLAPSTDLSRLPYLVRDFAISYAPSATALVNLRKPARELPPASFLAFADPSYTQTPPPEGSSTHSALRSTFGANKPWLLQPLPHSRLEVERIASLFPKQQTGIYLGAAASEENVKAADRLSHYRFIHFAVHGLLNENMPRYSGLVLSLPAASSKQQTSGPAAAGTAAAQDLAAASEDGLLQVYEIFNLRVNAELVALSACETGLGKEVRGEGLIGLSRAFMYAGTPSLLVSLWNIQDRSTAELMARFYQGLIRGKLGKAQALRQAQLEMIRGGKYAHPYHWAGFVLVGRP